MKFFFLVLFFYSCDFSDDNDTEDTEVENEKHYEIDSDGQIISTEFSYHDFNSAHDCMECHEQHFNEWSKSMHAHALDDDFFISILNRERELRPITGENYCIQCHAPIAYLSDYSLSDINTSNDLINLPASIIEGVTCTFCHTMTNTSSTVFTGDNVSAEIDDYHLNPGQGIFYGSIESPDTNSFHNSKYNVIYTQSESCLPCHDQFIREKDIETTFTEWQRVPGFGMSGSFPCQECHMPVKDDGHHDHTFAAIDVDLNNPQNLYNENLALLETSVIIDFNFIQDSLSLSNGDTLSIPINVESLTGHRFPSGTSFTREAWIELSVYDNDIPIYQSGNILSSSQKLDLLDTNLLLFTTWLLDENGDTTFLAGNAHDFINQSLPALGQRFHTYNFIMNDNYDSLNIEMKMLFRALKPDVFDDDNMHLIDNVPIYEINSVSKTIFNIVEIY